MNLGGMIRGWQYGEAVARRVKEYGTILQPAERLACQLKLWNQEWGRILEDVPYYQELAVSKGLPKKFVSWEHFLESLPVVHRQDIQRHGQAMASLGKKADYYRTTGGSTAQPLKIPGWKSEIQYIWPNFWWALTWHGVNMGSRQFMVWGRSHTLGSGLKGALARQKRRFYDSILGIYRQSAYDLSPEAMRQAANVLLREKPDYIYGYSVALDQFARANLELRPALRSVGVKVVFGTAESFPASDSVALLQDLFDCPVAMEYGSVETGAIAFSCPPEYNFKVFWQQYFIEAEHIANSSRWRIRVTSLYPRCFPLIRYDLGDEIELSDNSNMLEYGLTSFNKVIGRCNSFVELPNGVHIHSEAFTHAVKVIPNITAYQVIQEKNSISIQYIRPSSFKEDEIRKIRQRLHNISPLLENVKLVKVNNLQQTVAGKTPMIIKK